MAPDRLGRRPVGEAHPPRRVVLDTSFLIAVMQKPTPWAQDLLEKRGAYRLVLLEPVRRELERLAARRDRRARFASLALAFASGRGVEQVAAVSGRSGAAGAEEEPNGVGTTPDDEVVSFALREGCDVATMDSDLAARLRALRIRVVTLRGGRLSTD